jgi:hypothetical protein
MTHEDTWSPALPCCVVLAPVPCCFFLIVCSSGSPGSQPSNHSINIPKSDPPLLTHTSREQAFPDRWERLVRLVRVKVYHIDSCSLPSNSRASRTNLRADHTTRRNTQLPFMLSSIKPFDFLQFCFFLSPSPSIVALRAWGFFAAEGFFLQIRIVYFAFEQLHTSSNSISVFRFRIRKLEFWQFHT